MSIELVDDHSNAVNRLSVDDAEKILKQHIEYTPIVKLDDLVGRIKLVGKYEAAQIGGSFKARGAYIKMRELYDQGESAVVTASAGNHAVGVAAAAKRLGMHADVYLPQSVSRERAQRVIDHGTDSSGKEWASVIMAGSTVDQALNMARSSLLPVIEPFDDLTIIAGQATVGREIIQQTEARVDRVFVPVGGGGLAAGTLEAFADYDDIEIVLVQLSGNDSAERSFYAQQVVPASSVNNLAIGSAVREIGQNCLDIILRHGSKVRFVTVDPSDVGQCIVKEDQLRQEWLPAMGSSAYEAFPEVTGFLAEAGARKLAMELAKSDAQVEGELWVAVMTGSNVDHEAELIATRAYHDLYSRQLSKCAMSTQISHSYIGRC